MSFSIVPSRFLISDYPQQDQDGRTDPLKPEFHKEFSSLVHSGGQREAVRLGRVFLLLVFVGKQARSGVEAKP
jgi:hypothetical protein